MFQRAEHSQIRIWMERFRSKFNSIFYFLANHFSLKNILKDLLFDTCLF